MSEKERCYDPLFLNARREARVILGVWALCGIFTVAFCYHYGYISHEPLPDALGPPVGEVLGGAFSGTRDPGSLSFPLGLGIPDWVFFGILMPWVFCILFTFWFCLFYFSEDELPEVSAEEQPDEFS